MADYDPAALLHIFFLSGVTWLNLTSENYLKTRFTKNILLNTAKNQRVKIQKPLKIQLFDEMVSRETQAFKQVDKACEI